MFCLDYDLNMLNILFISFSLSPCIIPSSFFYHLCNFFSVSFQFVNTPHQWKARTNCTGLGVCSKQSHTKVVLAH